MRPLGVIMVFLLVAAAKCSSKELWKVRHVLMNLLFKNINPMYLSSTLKTSRFNLAGIHGSARNPVENPIHSITDLFIVNNIDNGVIIWSIDSIYISKMLPFIHSVKGCIVVLAFCFFRFLSLLFLFICPVYIQIFVCIRFVKFVIFIFNVRWFCV